jgi:hypothetical protein
LQTGSAKALIIPRPARGQSPLGLRPRILRSSRHFYLDCALRNGVWQPRAYQRPIAYWLIPPTEKMAGTGPAIFQCSNTDRAPDDLVTVGADRGARAVVLKRAGPAGRRTSRRRSGLDYGEQERESQSNLGQHGRSPCAEARSGFCGLDQRSASLFPRSHLDGVRSVQVFVVLVGMQFTSASVVPRKEPSVSGGDVDIFDVRRHDWTLSCHHVVMIDVFRETGLQGGSLCLMRPLGRSTLLSDQPRAHASFACPGATHLLPGARPMQALRGHHDIMMDWPRRSFERSYLCPPLPRHA